MVIESVSKVPSNSRFKNFKSFTKKVAAKANIGDKVNKKHLVLALAALSAVAAAGIVLSKGKKINFGNIRHLDTIDTANGRNTQRIQEQINEIVTEVRTRADSGKIAQENARKAQETAQKIKNKLIQAEVQARIEAGDREVMTAYNAQEFYRNLFEGNLSHKSAKDSAQVFEEGFRQKHLDEINAEIRARVQAQNLAVQNAQRAQERYNKPFEDMLSHKSAQDSAKVFNEDFLKDVKNSRRYTNGNIDVEIKGKGALYDYDDVSELQASWDFGRQSLDVKKPMKGDQPAEIASRTYRYGDHEEKVTMNFQNNSQSLKAKDGKAKFKTVIRENDKKIVWHKPDGTTEVLHKPSRYIEVFDSKGNIIDGYPQRDSQIRGVRADAERIRELVDEFMDLALEKGESLK